MANLDSASIAIHVHTLPSPDAPAFFALSFRPTRLQYLIRLDPFGLEFPDVLIVSASGHHSGGGQEAERRDLGDIAHIAEFTLFPSTKAVRVVAHFSV